MLNKFVVALMSVVVEGAEEALVTSTYAARDAIRTRAERAACFSLTEEIVLIVANSIVSKEGRAEEELHLTYWPHRLYSSFTVSGGALDGEVCWSSPCRSC